MNNMNINKKFKKLFPEAYNYVYKISGTCFVSYNPSIPQNVFDDILVAFSQADSREGKDETALKTKDTWMILNGDFTDEYAKCKTVKQAVAVYKKYKKEHRSGFSTD